MIKQEYIHKALSSSDDVSISRIILVLMVLYILVITTLLFIFDAFTLEKGWYLLGLATLAFGNKTVAKFNEVRREFRNL